ncbi:hypothetical protein MYX77_04360 [Acidobacteriia bacterium AH_259_A11_L15]|nr:hypothetical protein [Acidobacteriia bacterium AH_259_A11_L15]
MPQLYLHNKPIESIFELLGRDENDITCAVGWALYSSPAFLRGFLKETIHYEGEVSEVTIRLQDYRRTQGITDIEIRVPGEFYLVVEAKKGWNLPGVRQLRKYALRLCKDGCRTRRILVLSECSAKYAEDHLERRNVRGIPVQAISWKAVAHVASRALPKGNHREKRLLREMLSYLGRIVTVQDIKSNRVYVVSLTGRGIINVTRKGVYFHPVGVHGWPKEPPNYVAFRYDGKLQSIHHVNSYELADERELHKRGLISRVPPKERTVHFLYKLGPAIAPPREVRTGKRIVRNNRVWCMFDALLTCKTISEAHALSKKRSKMAERLGG